MKRIVRNRYVPIVVALSVGCLLVNFALGCGGGSDDVQVEESGQLSVFPDPVTFSRVPVGETETETVTILNSGESDLRIFRTQFRADDGSTIDDLSIADLPDGGFTLPPGEEREITVEFSPQQAGRPNSGVLRVFNSDPEYGENDPFELQISTLGNSPQLRVSPRTIRFPPLPPGEREVRTATLSNSGDAPLDIFDLTISGSSDFRIQNVDEELPAEVPAPTEGAERKTVEVDIEYAPTESGSRTGELVIESNEEPGATAEDPEVRRVDINANADTPCLRIVGKTDRSLGPVPIGGSTRDSIVVESCSSETLRISAIEFTENSEDSEFSLDLGSRDGNADGELDEDIVLAEEGEKVNLPVKYEPEQEGSDRAVVTITSNDPFAEGEVALAARGADGECPESVVRAKPEGGTVWDRSVVRAAPLDYIKLDGSLSEDPDGSVEKYEWRVIEKPEGTTVSFEPWKDAPDSDTSKRRVRLLVAGEYKVGLTVEDNDGFGSCEEAVVQLSAETDEKVTVELTWQNPNDPDQNDDNGDDVDLHMVKLGPGKWFEEPYDIFFDNPNNSSGSGGGSGIWNPESPSLDRDDRNSLGPENIQMDNPQDCQWYAIGVHYYEEKFPPAFATIRIFLGDAKNNLVFERRNVKLEQGGIFWDVARIHWDSKQVVSVDRFFEDKSAVDGESPEVTSEMESSGLCSSQNLFSN